LAVDIHDDVAAPAILPCAALAAADYALTNLSHTQI